jgi:hypothetical protein
VKKFFILLIMEDIVLITYDEQPATAAEPTQACFAHMSSKAYHLTRITPVLNGTREHVSLNYGIAMSTTPRYKVEKLEVDMIERLKNFLTYF